MRLHPRVYFCIALLMIVLASCSDKSGSIPVPADASMVLHIDGGSLNSKFGWDEFKKGQLYKIASSNIMDSMQKVILDNPEASGIDIKSDAYVFYRTRGNGGYVGFTFVIKDRDAFEKMLKSIGGGHKEIEKEGSLSVIKERSTVITWNNKRFVLISNSGGMAQAYSGKTERFREDSLLKFANEVYELKGKNSIASDKRFADMIEKKGDLHVWMNMETLYGGAMASLLPLKNTSELVKDNVHAFTVNFENGKISADGKSYYNEKLAAIYNKLNDKNLSEDMLKKIPSDNVVAVFAMNYPSDILKELFTMLGIDALADVYLSKMGTSINEIVASFKGDIMIAVTDPGMSTPPAGLTQEQLMWYRPRPHAGVLVATSLNDQSSFDKLLALVRQKTEESGKSFDVISKEFPHTVKDGWFIGSNDSSLVNNFGTTTKNHPFISKISGHSMGLYIDIQKIISGFFKKPAGPVQGPGEEYMGFQNALVDESIKTWQDIVAYSGKVENGTQESHFEINLVDKNTNSLKQIHDYIARIAQASEDMKARMRSEWERPSMDSVGIEQAPVEEAK